MLKEVAQPEQVYHPDNVPAPVSSMLDECGIRPICRTVVDLVNAQGVV
jgi:hypothetical protein